MIKNILYSLLLHSIFALCIFVSFYQKITEKIDLKDGLSVQLVSLEDIKKPAKIISKPIITTEKKEIVKPIKALKLKPKAKSPKDEAKKFIEEKKLQFKKTEEKITQEEVKKIEDKKIVETKEEEREIKQEEKITTTENISNIQNLENLQLSAREKFNIQSQLHACYVRSLKDNGEDNHQPTTINITILADGSIDFAQENFIDQEKYNKDAAYKKHIDIIMQTLELCSPLRNMPNDKYDIWREFIIEF